MYIFDRSTSRGRSYNVRSLHKLSIGSINGIQNYYFLYLWILSGAEAWFLC